ncbi:CRISPR-associated endonuclease Cas2 [Dactylosporangium sp. NPDC049525]|uniref:CRISPR-associated endonuclease Cas2 n=1 Tax=Dactylosporangium sp. NPDC049525 TaxID=3154730 RepID=UPI003414F015
MTTPRGRQVCVVVYDIADDDRRDDLYRLLSGIGTHVQLSVFEVELATTTDVTALRDQVAGLIDQMDDQVRIYALPGSMADQALIIGNRTLAERADFWLV